MDIPETAIRKRIEELVKHYHLDNENTRRFATLQIKDLVQKIEDLGGRVLWIDE